MPLNLPVPKWKQTARAWMKNRLRAHRQRGHPPRGHRLRGGHHISMHPCINCMALMLIPLVLTASSYMRMLRMTPDAFYFDE